MRNYHGLFECLDQVEVYDSDDEVFCLTGLVRFVYPDRIVVLTSCVTQSKDDECKIKIGDEISIRLDAPEITVKMISRIFDTDLLRRIKC